MNDAGRFARRRREELRRLAIGLSVCAVLLAGCESAPPKGPKSLLEKTTVTDSSGTREVRPTYLTPQTQPTKP